MISTQLTNWRGFAPCHNGYSVFLADIQDVSRYFDALIPSAPVLECRIA
jgi:hypothetical protein